LRKLSSAVEQSPISIVITDADGKIEYVNPAFTKISGYAADEAMGNTPRILSSGIHPKEFYETLWSTITSGDTWLGEMQNRSKDGNIFWESVSIAPIFDDSGAIVNFVGLKEEIGDRKALEASLRASKKIADKANQAKSEFLSSMSHELRTPLNAILGFGQMLELNPKEPLTKNQKSCVEHIKKGGHHLLELINEILDLAIIEAGKLKLSIEDVSATSVLDECILLVRTMADDRGIEIGAGKGFETKPMIRADYTRFRQTLLNLMSNAVKYNREKGTISVDCREAPGGMLHISVSDTGEGIPDAMLEKLFEPFTRLKEEHQNIEGAGIGLTITKQLVERMDGKIGVESQLGKGTTFWIELPLAEIHSVAEKAGDRKTAEVAAKTLPDIAGTVLYIEDNPANLELMQLIVKRIKGLSLISATDAETGIEPAKNESPDLIILDINLPGMDGFEALEKLQGLEGTKEIPVIALSANAMPKEIEKGMEAGFRQYLTKPIKVEEVVSSVRNALAS
jgi:PAS domain S-box-containing protein